MLNIILDILPKSRRNCTPMKQNSKHAFLILAHTQPELLKRLLMRLNHNRVDIFLHLDRKLLINEYDLKTSIKHANLYFTPRLNVTWGGYSIIRAELLLLEKATNTGIYSFYHLLSGQDYLLQSIDKVLNYYDKTPDINYISFKQDEVLSYIDRLRLLYPLQELIGRSHGILYFSQQFLKLVQKAFKLYRTIPDTIGFGSQFFDITDNFARWIVKNQDNWNSIYKNTVCADEMFVQSLYLMYAKLYSSKLCYQEKKNYETFDKAGLSIKRAIDWKRGNPYVWTKDDFESLKSSGLLFVRKVDENKSQGLLDLLDRI